MAAGLGFKTFTVGEVLSAADVNGYLMQGVLVFATTAARDAAITSPQEGQFAFTKDTNSLFYYDGAAWVASGATGDIEGVTAGTGISGGGTSGTVTVTNSMATAIDAKGDLIVGTGADTFSRLAAGTNTYILTSDSAEATGLKWAAPAGGGKVLQVVQGTTTTSTTISTSTMTDTTITATITPTLNTSKILVMANSTVYSGQSASTTYVSTNARLMRDATVLTTFNPFQQIEAASATGYSVINQVSLTYLDSPATTSAITYKVQGSERHATSMIWQQRDSAEPASTGVIILMEIGA